MQPQSAGSRNRQIPNTELPNNVMKPKNASSKLGQQQDTALTKVFVGGLAWETTSESLQNHFSSYGEIVEAAVIVDRQNGRSKGYGFVTYKDETAAERAIQDPNPIIDDRKTNCVLAAEGARKRFITVSGSTWDSVCLPSDGGPKTCTFSDEAWMKSSTNGTITAGMVAGGQSELGGPASTSTSTSTSTATGIHNGGGSGPRPWGYYVVYGQPPFHFTEYGFQPVIYIPPGPMPPTSVYGAYIPASFTVPTNISPDVVVAEQEQDCDYVHPPDLQ